MRLVLSAAVKLRRLIAMLALLPISNGCCFLWGEDVPMPTVDGPEDPHLAESLQGWVLWAGKDQRTVEWLELPDLAQGKLRSKRDVTHLLGVDSSRRLLYIDRKDDQARLRACPLDQASPVTLHVFDSRVTTADLDPACRWLLYDSGESLEYRELRDGRLTDPRPIPASDWNVGAVRWLIPGQSVVYEALGRFQTPTEMRVVDLAEGRERAVIRLIAYLDAVDPQRMRILLRQGDPQRSKTTIDAWEISGETKHEPLVLPGLLFNTLGVSREGLVVYEGMPTTGTKLASLGWGLTWPRSKWTIKLADPRTGKFQTLVPYFDIDDEFPTPMAFLR